jgi:hypothetical protein
MVEVELAKGEAEHADRRVDDAFPRKGRDQKETLASWADNVEQPFPREALVRVRGCVSKVVEILFRRPPSGLICV